METKTETHEAVVFPVYNTDFSHYEFICSCSCGYKMDGYTFEAAAKQRDFHLMIFSNKAA